MYGRRKYGRYAKRRVYKRRKYGIKKAINRQITRRLAPMVEKKFNDVNTSGTITNVPVFIRLSAMGQGTTDSTRAGDAIYARNLQYRIYLTAADTTNVCRVVLFMWHGDDNFTSPTDVQIWQNPLDIKSYFNWDSLRSNKFKILYDKIHTIETGTEDSQRMVKVFKKIYKKISFTGGNNACDHIYCALLSDSGVAPHPGYAIYSRLTFTDS